MSGYDIIVFLHVLSAVVWVGGGFMLQVLLARARGIGPDSVTTFSQAAEWVHQRLFMPASIAALAFGIWAVISGPWTFGEGWIVAGLAGFAISSIIGMAVLGPTSKRLHAATEEREVTQLGRRLAMAGRVDLVVLIVVVFNMVVKPG